MNETFSIELFGGSQDGAVIDIGEAPDVFLIRATEGVKEIYKRQNTQPPFIYVQTGYAEIEPSK
jgi:hypothetical protein